MTAKKAIKESIWTKQVTSRWVDYLLMFAVGFLAAMAFSQRFLVG